jgi:hypothetical protein
VPQQPFVGPEEDVIVASNDFEGVDVEPIQDIQFEPPHEVDVFIPMDNGEPLQLLPDDILEDELMDVVDLFADNPTDNHLHNLGFVKLLQPEVDPVLTNKLKQTSPLHAGFLKQNPEALRLWAKCLAPGPGAPTVQVPRLWADFFTLLLVSPCSFQ